MSVHHLPIPTPPAPILFEDQYGAHAAEPIVIDNGI